ncbi:MAG: endonuclease NucS domain-containing protein [Nitrospirota bacterium]
MDVRLLSKKEAAIFYDLLAKKNRPEDISTLTDTPFGSGWYLYRMAYSGETSFFVAEYPSFKLRPGVDDSRYPAKGFVAAAVLHNAAKEFVDVRDIANELKIDEDHWYWLSVRLAEASDVFIQRGALKIGIKSDDQKILTMRPRKSPHSDSARYSALTRGLSPLQPKSKSERSIGTQSKKNIVTEKPRDGRLVSAVVQAGTQPKKEITQKLHEANIESIILQNLNLMEEGLELVQRQYVCSGVGRIDLLCKDRVSNLVVIELKGFSTKQDTIIDQITRYMGWVKEHVAEKKQKVRGLIVVPKADEKLKYAVGAIPNVEIKTFNISFP